MAVAQHLVLAAGVGALALLPVGPAEAGHDFRDCRYDCGIPFRWDDEPPAFDNPPLPEGFVLTVPVPARPDDRRDPPALLNRYAEVGLALGRCWDPTPAIGDRAWRELTLRVSFKRNGGINGVPRIPFVSAPDPSTVNDLRSSLLDALSHCAPLHFSPSLGNAIAGQIFAIHFIQQGQHHG